MTRIENEDESRGLLTARWLVVAALGASALIMGVAAFAWMIGPDSPSQSGLPEVTLPAYATQAPSTADPSTIASDAGAAVASSSATPTPTPAGAPDTAAHAAGPAGTASPEAAGDGPGGTSAHPETAVATKPDTRKPSVKGNTGSGDEHASSREVVEPEVRVEEHPHPTDPDNGESGGAHPGATDDGGNGRPRSGGNGHDAPNPPAGD
jgi:hypothetical protein